MDELQLSDSYYATGDGEGSPRHGEVFHTARNDQGGAWCTPVARYFSWRPSIPAEGYHPHWRLDCFVREDGLAPDPEWLGSILADALVRQGAIAEPLWIAWHRSHELGGDDRGDVFDFE